MAAEIHPQAGNVKTAGIAADLEEGLGEAAPFPCRHVGDAGGFGMEDGGSDADQGG